MAVKLKVFSKITFKSQYMLLQVKSIEIFLDKNTQTFVSANTFQGISSKILINVTLT
jgi:hypothetical protein